ncbi:hypothetical protein P1X15_10965 [Runella sp. MFBS21]|uniref:hypothetical protein n=1 Tax=Runella sp. MFBS21 TaxID=3034018 RepID=UPI0023F618F4|nr:hypothetical protein [Runella sp. MFBS21]MDF7818121.1 hypothetical protein [Runella sp. MFBS21]
MARYIILPLYVPKGRVYIFSFIILPNALNSLKLSLGLDYFYGYFEELVGKIGKAFG